MPEIRDLIYFDFDRAASLLSQVEGGLLQETQAGSESAKDQRNTRKYDLKFFKPEFEGVSEEKQSILTTRVLHHDLLGRLEEAVQGSDVFVDINEAFPDSRTAIEPLHDALSKCAYVRSTGRAIIQDFDRLKAIASKHNDLCEFLGRCSMSSLEKSEDYQRVANQLDAARAEVEAIKDRNKRSVAEKKLGKQQATLRAAIEEATGLGTVDQWLLDGVQFFVDMFMPGRILLSVHPIDGIPSFRVLANLKRACFVDGDLESVVHAYGNRPNVDLTVLGLVTSLPAEENTRTTQPESTDDGGDSRGDYEAFERGFTALFESFDEYYKFVSFSRYPSVTVHPIAVYRHVGDISPG